MATKRKIATKTAAKTASKTAAAPGQAKSRKFSAQDNVTALVIAAAIVIAFAALYLYQQNAKAKAAQLDGIPAIVSIEQA